MSKDLSPEECLEYADKINEVFKAIDLDGNGLITRAELRRLFQRLNPDYWDDETVDTLLTSFDRDGDGKVSFNEFVTWTCSSKTDKRMLDKVLRNQAIEVARAIITDDQILFNAFDTDEDKKIGRADLQRLLEKLVPSVFTETELKLLTREFDTCDKNHDGTLTIKEFMTLTCTWKTDPQTRNLVARDIAGDIRAIIEQEAAEARERELQESLMRKRRRLENSEGGRAVLQFLKDHPALAKSSHELHQWVLECRHAIVEEADDAKAIDIVTRMALWAENETKILRAAFDRFNCNVGDGPDAGSLSRKEVQTMLEYLGFPSTDKDVDDLLARIDKDEDGYMNFDEFTVYVGKTGGLNKLFEMRRKQLDKSRRDSGSKIDLGENEKASREVLLETGILDDAQTFWRLVVPESELLEMANLLQSQKRAVRHIRQLAAANHERAIPILQERFQRMGFSETELWLTLAFIREQAPIVIQIKLDKLMGHFETDTHYRNQFETGTSHGTLSTHTRTGWERNLFGDAYDQATGFDRPKYGVLNMMNDHRGVVRASAYGDSYFILKDVRLRVTCSPKDSSVCNAERLAVLDYFAHVLMEFRDDNLAAVVDVANGRQTHSDSSKLDHYKEIQIHGEIHLDKHIERLVAAPRHKGDKERIRGICEKHGWALSWMDDDENDLREKVSPSHKLMIPESEWMERVELCHSISLRLSPFG